MVVNHASVAADFEHSVSRVLRAGGRVVRLFSPQHGFSAEKQANMIESEHGRADEWNLPVYSLYGDVRQPTPEMLEGLDVLLVDLWDVGTRVYTFANTMGLCMEAAGRAGVKVAVLDRPNPIGGLEVEGNPVKEQYRSFVGQYPLPMRHGLTMGELARLINERYGAECELEVIPMKGWRRFMHFPDTGLPWVFPSPNMPSYSTALVYPGTVLLEGTNVSEGRGTTLPFELVGAPFIEPRVLIRELLQYDLEGVAFRPVSFVPMFDKWRGEECFGFQIHVTDRERFRPYLLGLALLASLIKLYPEHFRCLNPPYEYEFEKLPIEILLGDRVLREMLEAGAALEEMEGYWRADLESFLDDRQSVLIYPE
jgi:uncharacterized protein YbbC (DUF1343 family)